jgi:hypothetical protein
VWIAGRKAPSRGSLGLVLHRNGPTWSRDPLPDVRGHEWLFDLAVLEDVVWAVGWHFVPEISYPFAVRWTAAWERVATDAPRSPGELVGVAADDAGEPVGGGGGRGVRLGDLPRLFERERGTAMTSSQDERLAREDFSARYSVGPSSVLDAIESRVIGEAWGANGFTTVTQADLLGERLGLTDEKRLLDVGTGRGWPGLYLARQTGCEVVLTDLPIEGLQIAIRRGAREDVRCLGGASSSARYLPFRAASFDALVHTDVLC